MLSLSQLPKHRFHRIALSAVQNNARLNLERGNVDRKDAISLLREIMDSCHSFVTAKAVAISMDKQTNSWVLNVYWTPHPSESGCLDKILVERGLEVVTTNERMVFQSKQNPTDAPL